MSKSLIVFVAVISFLAFVSSNATSYAISNTSVDLINQERVNRGLKKIETDENLCTLTKMLADDRELSYPEKINDNLFSNSKYKEYIKDYSNYVTAVLTLNDVLIKAYNNKGVAIPLFTAEQIAQQSIAGGQAVAPEITHGCSAISSGKIGYKPYAYFIGGVKKEAVSSPSPIPFNNNISSVGFFNKIKIFFINIFSIIHF